MGPERRSLLEFGSKPRLNDTVEELISRGRDGDWSNELPDQSGLLCVDHLTKRLGDAVALRDVSFTVPFGAVCGIVGAIGAGKTTLVRLVAGDLAPSEGVVSLTATAQGGAAAGGEIRGERRWISRDFQLPASISVGEYLATAERSQAQSSAAPPRCLDEVVSTVGLSGILCRTCGELRRGIQKLVVLTHCLISRPAVVAVDELTIGEDANTASLLWRVIGAIARSGTTVVTTAYFMHEAERCDVVAYLVRSRLLAFGSPESLKQQIENRRPALRCVRIECPFVTRAVELLGQVKGVWSICGIGRGVDLALDAASHVGTIVECLRGDGIEVNSISNTGPSLATALDVITMDQLAEGAGEGSAARASKT